MAALTTLNRLGFYARGWLMARVVGLNDPDPWAGEPVTVTPLIVADGQTMAGGSGDIRCPAPPSSSTTTAGSGTTAPGGWRRDSTGVLVPVGALVTTTLTGDRLADLIAHLDQGADRRGLHLPALPRRIADRQIVESWADFLEPHFGSGQPALNLTGTYSDKYGEANGLMHARNVMADFQRFLRFIKRDREAGCIGVELAPQGLISGRPYLHFHALIGGNWPQSDLQRIELLWGEHRGWARAKLTDDRAGCIEYAAKHLLKQGAADNFDFWPSSRHTFVSRQDRRIERGRSW
jgi:hypothetical protein